MTPTQCRTARHLLGWSRERLATESGIEVDVVRLFELTGRAPNEAVRPHTVDSVAVIRNSLKAGGIEFTNSDVHGVRLKKAPT